MLPGLALLAWAVCTLRANAGLIDIFWSLFITLPPLAMMRLPPPGARAVIVPAIAALWAVRLAAHLARRNWNAPEDHRYQAIRARNQPGFTWKSLYLVFGLQALLAWVVALPLSAVSGSTAPFTVLDALGVALALAGIAVEWIADAQLAQFRADPATRGRVLEAGLWRYSRHPNYFGEFCVWWGLGLSALATGAWWALASPLLMSVLLLRVSGVTLLERDINTRRPEYARYIRSTNAFFPGPRKPA